MRDALTPYQLSVSSTSSASAGPVASSLLKKEKVKKTDKKVDDEQLVGIDSELATLIRTLGSAAAPLKPVISQSDASSSSAVSPPHHPFPEAKYQETKSLNE